MNKSCVIWVRYWPPGDLIVWCDVKKLDASWKADSDYVDFGGKGSNQRPKYNGVGRWLEKTNKLWMPHIGLGDTGEASFTDGRHRFAWLRDHGAISIRVTADPSTAPELRKRLGTRFRRSEFSHSKNEVT